MDPEKLMQLFLENEGVFDDMTLLEFKRKIWAGTHVWAAIELSGLITKLAREVWAPARTEQGSLRELFYARLAAYAEGVYSERFHVAPR